MTTAAILLVPAALAGLCLGSFVTTAAFRSARGEQWWAGRSHCDGCHAPLAAAQTLPVWSYFSLRGACSACGAAIDPGHLAGELAGCGVVVSALMAAEPVRAVWIAALGLVLLASAAFDAKTRRLPDALTLAIGILGAGLALSRSSEALETGLIAAAVAFALLEAVRRGFQWLRRKSGLGFGDVKLIAALALWLGVATPWAVALAAGAALVAVLVRPSQDGRLAFGPWIAASAFIVGVAQEASLWPILV
jgi:leader peptidase (prepilin peptidase)/N-methyltransferase